MTACAHLQVEMDGTRASDLPPCTKGLHTNHDPVQVHSCHTLDASHIAPPCSTYLAPESGHLGFVGVVHMKTSSRWADMTSSNWEVGGFAS